MANNFNLFPIGINMLEVIYQSPYNGRTTLVVGCALGVVCLQYYILGILQIAHSKGDISILAQCVESLTNISQAFFKLIIVNYYKQRILKLINDCQNMFWKTKEFPHMIPELRNAYKISYYLQQFYKLCLIITLVSAFVKSLIIGELLVLVWLPHFQYSFTIIQAGLYLIGFSGICYMCGIDNLFVSFCTHLVIQFKMINQKIKTINYIKECSKVEMRQCVDHHNFLISFAEELNIIYSILFLVQYLITVGGICMQMFMFTDSSPPILRSIQCVITSLCFLAQMGLICFPASAVTIEAEKLADSIYESNWYHASSEKQKEIALLLMRAQKEIKFLAGGMADINRATFTFILQTIMSFFTLMKNIREFKN